MGVIKIKNGFNVPISGPPMMNQAMFAMLDNIGVELKNILYDDFGI